MEAQEFGAQLQLDFDVVLALAIPSQSPALSKPKKKPKTGPGPNDGLPSKPSTSESNYWEEVSKTPIWPGWLLEQATAFILSAGSSFQSHELASTILAILQSTKSEVELQNKLFELLGDASFDFITVLLKNRKEILSFGNGIQQNTEDIEKEKKTTHLVGQVTVTSEQDKFLNKIKQKERKKKGKQTEDGTILQDEWLAKNFDSYNLREQREMALNAPKTLNLAPMGSTSDKIIGFGQKVGLPEGTVKIQTKLFEEVTVPYTIPAPYEKGEKLVTISELDDWAQVAFKGYTSLNRIQSRLFNTAYKSNENMLVCAPTGAGKTDVAMMTVLHEIGQHYNGGRLQRDNFKIVYVAPMKALAAEITSKFSKRLSPLGIIVKELTGDMQLTKRELSETQMIVTTPEKWDVITRKSGDVALTSLVRLLIIDEVHLLHEDRGPVIEVLVARTLRQVETTQSMIRIVGLSATLPNYKDVAHFLRVNFETGLFYFDSSYRPVPLTQQFIGVKETNPIQSKAAMTQVCYDKVINSLMHGNQVMIFVHSRKDTAKTAQNLIELARENGTLDYFLSDSPNYRDAKKQAEKSRNKELKELFQFGFGIHHAGMLRSDRNLTERLFSEGFIRVLCCTATLAWGVNLPAHTVIIKGTQLYDPKQGTYVDLGMLDVMQIFGRAGRPQFDKSGEGIIITTHDKLAHYLALLTHQLPIESQFISQLADHLNAEIILGTVSNVKEAVTWLSYTYLYIRMIKNPQAYGITYQEKEYDQNLLQKRRSLIISAAQELDKCRMIRFDEKSENFFGTDNGRVASHFYINHESIASFNEELSNVMDDSNILGAVSQANEFENIMLREEEMEELGNLKSEACPIGVKGGSENKHGKVNILLQAYLSHANIDGFTLVSDSAYIVQNAGRILRGLFDMVDKKGWALMSARILNLCKMVERRLWDFQHPLRQMNNISAELLYKLEEKKADLDKLKDMNNGEIGQMIKHPRLGSMVARYVHQFPQIEIEATIQPITRTVLRVQLTIVAMFEWNDKLHGSVEPWWIWIEDADNEQIYHSEYFLLYKQMKDEPQKINFTIPILEPLPPQYYVHAISDRWLSAETIVPISFKHLILPELYPPHTELLDLQPLPVTALHNKKFEALFSFSHFNPIQTQVFFTMYHTDTNVLLGAPTGSGKTIGGELAMLKVFRDTPHLKVIYIGPLKALVRERLKDWEVKFGKKLGKKVVELTGEYTPNVRALESSDIVLTTPEKWDGISRNWQTRNYVKTVSLIIIDEIHLLGEERGPILEVIVSRMRYISSQTDTPVRIVGLSTALANAKDLADWLGIEKIGLFNFKPSVRPVPLQAFIQGYPGKHYCPRMATMNKPIYAAINSHSPEKPTLIFVSSRRQTRLTANDLIALCAGDGEGRHWLHMSHDELEFCLRKVRDPALKHTLPFGIGLHHAGLADEDKEMIENLFSEVKIQVLISTSTLAWGVNLPAHLVIIKGTEYYDPKTKQYVDFPITDVLQMMGRAGRPQFDSSGKAVIMVHEPKKNFYKKFLYEPFPVESSLPNVLHDHFNAEIVAGTISSKQDAIDYLTWTYFFRRLLMNPSYYSLDDTSFEAINAYLSEKVDSTIEDLMRAQCVGLEDDEVILYPMTMGRIVSYYYLHHTTAQLFTENINAGKDIPTLLSILTKTSEYEELPVRHNEDNLNSELATRVPWAVDSRTFDSPHTKAHLLLQSHFSRITLPISDYITDTKSVLDQAIRILQAMVDVAADGGWLDTALNTMHLMQMVMQGLWFTDSTLLCLPHFNEKIVSRFEEKGIDCLPQLLFLDSKKIMNILNEFLSDRQIKEILRVIEILPSLDVSWKLSSCVPAGSEILLKIELDRLSKSPRDGVYAPRYPKRKDEGAWLVVGDLTTGELIALRRIRFQSKKTSATLVFDAPDLEGHYTYTLFLMSDSYLGFDQQYELKFAVTSKKIEESKEEDDDDEEQEQ